MVTPENMNTDWFVDLMVDTHFEERRCLYENDEVLVMHKIATFPSGNRDATLSVLTKKMASVGVLRIAPRLCHQKNSPMRIILITMALIATLTAKAGLLKC